MNETDLFEGFPSVSAKAWKQRIQYDLKGADYNESLVWESLEGIKVKPFYHSEDLEGVEAFPFEREGRPWMIAQELYAADSDKTGHRALTLLQKGVDSPIFTLPSQDVDFKALLSKIELDRVPLHFNFLFLEVGAIKRLLSKIEGHKAPIYFNLDPIGQLVREGNWFHGFDRDFEHLGEVLGSATSQGPGSILGIDMAHCHEAGANAVQQLAYGLAHANEYLHHFAHGPRKTVFPGKSFPICFQVAMGSNYFFEIAKIRALRWLWNSLLGEYDLVGDCHILARPGRRNKTLYDYNVNLLRCTSECMSAILGGADTVCNLPYDALYHKDNEFGQRLARNQLLILREESHFNRISHAANGAYYIETLTRQLAQGALELFKGIEAGGGFINSLKKGSIQKKIKGNAAREQQLFDAGKIVSLGTNSHQNPEDRIKGELQLHPFAKTRVRKTLIEPIVARRLAEGLEQKRLEDE